MGGQDSGLWGLSAEEVGRQGSLAIWLSLSLPLSLSFAIALSLLVEPRSTPSVKPTLREALEPSDTRVPDSWEKIGKDVEVSKAEVRRRGCFLKAVEERIPGL